MPSFFVAYSAIELHIPPKSLPILPELSRFFPLLFMPLITNAEMEARRKEAADAWLATGNPLEDVEKLVNAYARNWTTAQCEKAKQLAAEAMRNGAQQDAPEVPAQPEAQPALAANMITCPKTETQVSDWTCSDCEQRAGCPAWAE